jgi:hypothetical protein
MQGQANWKNIYDKASAVASKEHEEAKRYADAANRAHAAAVKDRKELEKKTAAAAASKAKAAAAATAGAKAKAL